jgi:hypothetical protein
MASTLTQIANQKTALDQEFLSRQSVTWFQGKMKDLNSPLELAREIVNDKTRKRGRFQMGGLYHFFYDPLTKDKLPYYDTFPLVIPLQATTDGFIGLNLHYLPILYRAAFMDKLMDFAILNQDNDPRRLRVTYDILNASRNYREFKPCIKQYLKTQIKSRIVEIQPNEWETALFLPTAIFKGATAGKIYKESITKTKSKVY